MNIKRVNLHRQQQFYHLNTTRICRTQTKPRPNIHSKPITNYDTLTVIEYDIKNREKIYKEMLARLEQISNETKEFVIRYIEKHYGITLTEAQKKQITEYL